MSGSNGNNTTNRGALVTINQTNGAGTVVGTPVANVGLPGLAFHPDGRLFAVTLTNLTPSTLIQVNPDTGALITSIGAITDNGTPISIGDLSFQPGTGVLYGIRSQVGGGRLCTHRPSTGAATLIGDTTTGAGGGLAFAPNGTLYHSGYATDHVTFALNVISPVDGHVISSVGLNNFYDGLGIRSTDGVIFATLGPAGNNSDAIYTIDPVTGVTTLIGNTGTGDRRATLTSDRSHVQRQRLRQRRQLLQLRRLRSHRRLQRRQQQLLRLRLRLRLRRQPPSRLRLLPRGNRDANSYCDCHGDSHIDADTLPHTRGSEGTKRNQCDCQQLYRELEDRKRCGRLSVGRIHN